MSTIAFIGGGNMARSLIGGLITRGHPAGAIRVAEPVPTLQDALVADFGIVAADSNLDAITGADVVLFAVKPQVMATVCLELRAALSAGRPLLISIAAGISLANFEQWLGTDLRLIRAMPNTPALIGAGITGIYADPAVDADDRALAASVLAAVGPTVWIEQEALMDAVTAVSGSGPAYFFLLMESMIAAGVAQGLSEPAARELVLNTALGAARMAVNEPLGPAELRRRVTSPNGTTQAAIETFEAGGFRELTARAIARATERGRELSQQAGG
ncbi:pyrroline-5-carboxylate reductase [Ahniella affigens]|uniref:Pyrroline-5-carboxylate reductase n=1 Tax=Ahniella affigens TaxID=2021234 RepID=A0A2P1PNG3_9GAMM|nr:pyrroline-5-carboxylate reductase [Ahniella affigens]AVP96376.1 pyrroline-5-carboxylate reductase [Ahniella affigens]